MSKTQNGLEEKRFTSYKVYTVYNANGEEERGGYVQGLSLDEVRDETRFPLGPQIDAKGPFIWSYGINDGMKI